MAVLEHINKTVEANPGLSRRALSLEVCDLLDWRSPNGKLKEMSCRVALLKLHRLGQIQLPEPASGVAPIRAQRERVHVVPQISAVECELAELGKVELIPVDSRFPAQSRIWNQIMEAYHYLGHGTLCGAQIRYLIGSQGQGWLGGLSFSAAAWRLAPRDNWIGWTDTQREKNLSRVLCNSRFLILPQVKVANLASHVLGLAAGRAGADWVERYGFWPLLLETFVERDRFEGTCYRAANWRYIGTTSGRGRQDQNRLNAVPIKDIYIYPLCDGARELLCEGSARPPDAGQTVKAARDWAEEEFAQVELGDGRLTRRLVTIARDFYARPQASVPQACQSRARTKAAYRFFEHPGIQMDKVLSQHFEATLNRAGRHRVVLAVQDTTSLNYSTHPATENLGPIGASKDGIIGLLVHDTMAFDLEGTPLGLLDVQCWARDPKDFGKKKLRDQLPVNEKESYKWLRSYQKVAEAQRKCPQTNFVSVADREADVYELFKLALEQSKGPKLLVRAMQNRCLANEQGHVWDRMGKEPVAGVQQIHVPRRHNRAARVADLEVRFARLTLKPPERKAKLGELEVWAVSAREQNPLEGIEPIEWMLLTTSEVNSFEQAVEVLAWYTRRWGIEVYHRTLKSGCKIEERQLGAAERIEACLAIDMVVAWRIFHLTKLGREIPNVPCTVFFEEAEWKALVAYITQNPVAPAHPPTLREATRMVASLGGFLGRKCDGDPGTKSLWLGLQRLDDMTFMYKVLVPHPPVSSNPGYG